MLVMAFLLALLLAPGTSGWARQPFDGTPEASSSRDNLSSATFSGSVSDTYVNSVFSPIDKH